MIRKYLEKILETNANCEYIYSDKNQFAYRFKSDLAQVRLNGITIYDPFIINYNEKDNLVKLSTTTNGGANAPLDKLESLEIFVPGIAE